MKKLILFLTFAILAISAFSQTVRPRAYFDATFITGYKPTQTNYRDLWKSIFFPAQDTLPATQIVGVDEISNDATLSGANPRSLVTEYAVKSYVDSQVSGGGAVASVFGRTGAVVSAPGDYSATQITNAPSGTIAATTVQAAINELATEKLQDVTDAVDADNLAPNSVGASEISADAVGASEIAVDAVGASEIAVDAVGASEIAVDAVGMAEISTGAVGDDEIAANSVGNSEMKDDAIGSAEIIAESIAAVDIDTGAVTTSEILDGTIATADIADDAITKSKLADGTANRLLGFNGSGVASEIAAGSGITISGGTISASGGSGGIQYVKSSTKPTTLVRWIDRTTWDSTTVFQVKDSILNQGWKTVGWLDTVGYVFSDKPPLYLVITGQSNATPRVSGGDTTPSTYTTIWDANASAWQALDVTEAWMNGVGNQWWGMALGKEAARLDNRIVKIVYSAAGGLAISNWVSGTQKTALDTRIAASNIPRIDAFCWYQGESDYSRTKAQYAADFNTVLTNAASTWSGWSKNTKVIVAQLNTEAPYNNQNAFFNSLSTDTLSNTIVVKNTDLGRVDGQHINASAHETLGKRMYAAIVGREEYNASTKRWKVNTGSTISLENDVLKISENDTLVNLSSYVYNGWHGILTIIDQDSSGVVFNTPVLWRGVDGKIQISAIYKNFVTPAYYMDDTLRLTTLPPYHLAGGASYSPYSLGSLLQTWYAADTLVTTSGGKITQIGNKAPSNSRALKQSNNTYRPTPTTVNSIAAASFTPTNFLEVDTTGGGVTGVSGAGLVDIYFAIKTTDIKGIILQGDNTSEYLLFDTTAATGYGGFNSLGVFVDEIALSAATRKALGLALINPNTVHVVKIRQAQGNRINNYYRIMDYALNLSGFGTTGTFCEMLVTTSQFNPTLENNITQYLLTKWNSSGPAAIVRSDIGKETIENPFGGAERLNDVLSDAKDAIDLKAPIASPTFLGTVTVPTLVMTGRLEEKQGTDVASAADLTLGSGNTFYVTGTTNITAITTTGWQNGSEVTLMFQSVLNLINNTAGGGGTAPLLLENSGNIATTANDVIRLKLIGGNWVQVAPIVRI